METQPAPRPESLVVTSTSFGNGTIPVEHAVEGGNVAPAVAWAAVPEGTRSIAVVMDDVDAPKDHFVHWIVVGIPPHVRSIHRGGRLPEGAVEGTNDRGQSSYMGPNPPSGQHRYRLIVYALDIALEKPGMTKRDFESAIKGHVLAGGELFATYERFVH